MLFHQVHLHALTEVHVSRHPLRAAVPQIVHLGADEHFLIALAGLPPVLSDPHIVIQGALQENIEPASQTIGGYFNL